jgi:hypothetical protein
VDHLVAYHYHQFKDMVVVHLLALGLVLFLVGVVEAQVRMVLLPLLLVVVLVEQVKHHL